MKARSIFACFGGCRAAPRRLQTRHGAGAVRDAFGHRHRSCDSSAKHHHAHARGTTRGSDIGAAVAENSRTAGKSWHRSANAGVAPEDMQTAYFNVYTQVRYDEFGSPTDEVTYFVENTLTAVLRDTSQLSAALQGALDQGANSVQNVTYGLDDSAAALDEARTLAISDAQRQAELLAQAAGTQLGDLIAVTDFSGGPAYYLCRPRQPARAGRPPGFPPRRGP